MQRQLPLWVTGFANRFSRMKVYICAGSATAIATGVAIFCPRSAASYAVLVLLYNFCQGSTSPH